MVSVVMPVLNEEAHIGEQLAALAAQTYDGDWELVIADNGCVDRTLEVVEGWRGRLPAVRVVDADDRPGVSHARNVGAAAARGEVLACCDGDDVVDRDWLAALVAASEDADIVGGAEELEMLNEPVIRGWYGGRPHEGILNAYRFLPYVPGGNMAISSRQARQVGWNESFPYGGSDSEFCWRAQLGGLRLAPAPRAVIHRRYRIDLPSLARQAFGYGLASPRLYRQFRGQGMSRGLRRACATWLWILKRTPALLTSREGRGAWLYAVALRAGRLVGSIRHRALYL
jgi:glycosyltransferase involved in cell wall biosynthesis